MLSIIVPVLDEAQALEQLHREIAQCCEDEALEFELIFVDDGSSDSSWSVIEGLARQDPRVSGVRFRRNFGKAAALTAGMRSAVGEVLMMLDADLQDDPAEIPRFLAAIAEGYDVANGWKVRRQDPWHKVLPSKVFNWLVGLLTGLKLHDHNCGFKAFRAEVASEIRIYGELHRFIPVLAYARGFRVTELAVNHRPRRFGRSKYGVRRFVRGFLDLITIAFLTGFGVRPQHVLGAAGLVFFVLGLLGLGYLSLLWFLANVAGVAGLGPIGTRPLLAYSVAALLLGAHAISLGLLAELIVAYAGREAETYSVSQRTNSATAGRESVGSR